MESTFRPAILLTAGRTLGFIATFFIPIILVRLFTPSEFGTYKQLFLVHTTLYLIAQAGMAESLYYFLPGSREKAGRLVSNSLSALAVTGLLSFLFLETVRPALPRLLGNEDLLEYLRLLGAQLSLMIFASALEIVMISRKQYSLGAVSYAGSDLARAALILLPAMLFRSLEALLWGAMAFAALRSLVLIGYASNSFGKSLLPELSLLRNQLGYALPFGLAVVFEILQVNLHHYAVSYRFDSALFAVYSVGCLQIPLVEFLSTPLSSVLMVRMSETLRAGNAEAVIPLWYDAIRKLALILFPLTAFLLTVAHPLIVFLFTSTYTESVPIFMVWTTTIVLSAIPTDAALRVYAQTRFLLVLRILSLLFIAAGIGWFMTQFHLVGAVLASVLAAFGAKLAALIRVRRLMEVPALSLLPWKSLSLVLSASVLAATPAVMLNRMYQLSAAPYLMLAASLYFGTYLILLLALAVFSSEERHRLRGALVRVFNGFVRINECKSG